MSREFRLALPIADDATGADVAATLKHFASSSQLPIIRAFVLTTAETVRNERGYLAGRWAVIDQPQIQRGIKDICDAGEPAVDGKCGSLGCICASAPIQGEVIRIEYGPHDGELAVLDHVLPDDTDAVDVILPGGETVIADKSSFSRVAPLPLFTESELERRRTLPALDDVPEIVAHIERLQKAIVAINAHTRDNWIVDGYRSANHASENIVLAAVRLALYGALD